MLTVIKRIIRQKWYVKIFCYRCRPFTIKHSVINVLHTHAKCGFCFILTVAWKAEIFYEQKKLLQLLTFYAHWMSRISLSRIWLLIFICFCFMFVFLQIESANYDHACTVWSNYDHACTIWSNDDHACRLLFDLSRRKVDSCVPLYKQIIVEVRTSIYCSLLPCAENDLTVTWQPSCTKITSLLVPWTHFYWS